MSEKKRYLVTLDVKEARGFQQFAVEAASPEEALDLFKAGEGEFAGEEIEVTSLIEPSLECVQQEEI